MKKLIYVGCMLLAACSGNPNSSGGVQTVAYEYNASEPGAAIADVISSITILPIETTPASLISSEEQLFVHDGDYYFFNERGSMGGERLLRFDENGRFMNRIGTSGRAENEYLDIGNTYPTKEGIEVYSSQNKAVYSYSLDGKFIARKPFELGARQIVPADGGGYWAYMGYGNGTMPERVVKTDDAGTILEKFMPSDANVIGMSEIVTVFIPDGDNILVRESFGDAIHSIDPQGIVGEKYIFDFGRYNFPDSYFEYSDAMAAAMALFDSDFANLYSFFESRKHSVLQVAIQFGSSGEEEDSAMVTGFRSENEWQWVKSGTQQAPTILSGSVRALTGGDTVVLLVDNYKIREFAEQNPELVKNAEVLNGMDDEAANPSVLLCKLK